MRIKRDGLLEGAIALLIAIFVAGGFAAATSAGDVAPIHRTCKRIDKQIRHYEDVSEMALERRDWRWYDANQSHVQRLTDRRVKICPEQVAEERREYFRRGAEAARELVKLASNAAIRYFTAGGLPF